MLIAIITDTHYGVRNDNVLFLDMTKRFLNDVFFPYIDNNNITDVIHLGDLVDRRKYININTAKRLREDYINPLLNRKLNYIQLLGNHDTYFKNTNSVNSISELFNQKFPIFDTADHVIVGGQKILLLPWICDENRQHSMKLIGESDAQICMGHLEISGFEMYKGSPVSDGMDSKNFDRFDVTCSGHFHHKSTNGHIFYLGSHGEFTWSDFNDPKGFHVFDTETRELKFIQNPYTMFQKVWYNDTDKKSSDVLDIDFSQYKDKFIKVIVTAKTNPFWFDKFIDILEKTQCVDIQVVEDHLNLNLEQDEHIVNEAESTIDIFKKYIEQTNIDCDKDKLRSEIEELYKEAISIE